MSGRLCAEAFGTFCLVFAGTGAVVVDEVTGGGVTHVGVAIVFGLVVMALVVALAEVSGCHINPAVTLGLWAAGRVERSRVLPYIGSQCAGAFLASGLLRLLFPASITLGATIPVGGDLRTLVLEFVLTLMLVFVILGVTRGTGRESLKSGIVIGGVIGFAALFAGPISGASMNPARSLAPAVVSLHLGSLWVYVVAPIAGALASVPMCRCMYDASCCGPGHAGGCS